MDWPTDAECPCSAAVPQRTVWKRHCSGLELGKGGQLRLLPIFTFTQCHGCSLSTHSLWHIVLGVYLFLRAFDPPLYPATALQSAPVRKHCLLPAAVRPPWGSAARSRQHLPRLPPLTGLQDISVSAPVTSLPRLYRGTRPHVALPWHIFILCPHLSPAASWKAARSCSASQWRGISSLLPFCCSS